MSDIRPLLAALQFKGVRLREKDGELHYQSPPGALTAEDLKEIRKNKLEFLDFLKHTQDSTRSVPLFVPHARPDKLPVSPAQERLYFLEKLGMAGVAYNMPVALKLEGSLNLSAFTNSVDALIARHESLRTRFEEIDGVPYQKIEPNADRLVFKDLSSLLCDDREKLLAGIVQSEAHWQFDLHDGPLLRVLLVKLSEREHALIVTMHHIISDGWSIGVLIRELSSLYIDYSAGRESSLVPLPMQFADFAIWLRQCCQGEEHEKQLQYWKRHLAGAPPMSEFPTDRARPASPSFKGALRSFIIPDHVSRSLSKIAKDEGGSLHMAVLAAFKGLLARHSGQLDIVVGSPTAGRVYPGTEDIIGLFLNTLAFRTDLSGNPSYRELVRRVRNIEFGAHGHQDISFEKLVKELQPDRHLSRHPIFQILVEMQNLPKEVLSLPEIRWSLLPLENDSAKYDLVFRFYEVSEGIAGSFEYAVDLFEQSTIDRLIEHFQTILAEVAGNPGMRMWQWPLLTAREQETIKSKSEAFTKARVHPDLSITTDESIIDRFEDQVLVNPDRTAVSDDSKCWSYQELNAHADLVSSLIIERSGPGEGQVALLFEHGTMMIAGLIGVLKSGKAYVPLDPTWPVDRIKAVVKAAKVNLLLTENSQLELASSCIDSDRMAAIDSIAPSRQVRSKRRRGESRAYVLYTSGSTGEPKGVIQIDRNVLHFIDTYSRALKISACDRLTLFASYAFDAAVMDIFAALLNGASLHLWSIRKNGTQGLGDWIRKREVTIWHSTPSVFRLFSDAAARTTVSTVRLVVLGGEEARVSDLAQMKDCFGLGCVLVNGYGPTESTVTLQYFSNESDNLLGRRLPMGRPVENTEVFLLSPENEPTTLMGELVICSDHLAVGYLDNENQTQKVFSTNPATGGRAYRTGDLVRYRVDGSLEFLGRVDQQIKIRGYRVEIGEIESALKKIAGVAQAAIIPVDTVSGDKRLIAYVGSASDLVAEELRRNLARILPDYMLPSAYLVMKQLPLLPNGKLNRSALPAVDHSVIGDKEYEGPQGETEIVLASVWTSLTGQERIGRFDEFFKTGGDSVLAMRLISRIREKFDVEISLRAAFENLTLSAQAELIERHKREAMSSRHPKLTREARPERIPLSFAQERIWILDRMGIAGAAYNICANIRLQGALAVESLESSFSGLIARHESLRARFEEFQGTPYQRTAPPDVFSLEVRDLSRLTASQKEQQLRVLANQQAHRPFRLDRDQLLRIELVKLAADDHVLLMTVHHIVADGWSLGVMIRDVAELMRASCEGKLPELPVLDLQHPDFVLWQRDLLRADELQRQLSRCKERLRDISTLYLPLDRPRPPIPTFRGALVTFALEEELSSSLKALCKRTGVTLFSALLAGFKLLLARYSQQKDIVIGSPTANRSHSQLDGLVGCFINTLVIRTDLTGEINFIDLLRRVQRSFLDAEEDSHIPLEKVIDEIQPNRDLSRQPLFQVMFVLQNLPKLDIDLPGLRLSAAQYREHVTARFDLQLYMQEADAGITGSFEYAKDLYDETTISRMADHFQQLLIKVVNEPLQPLSRISFLNPLERHRILIEWNQTDQAYPRDLGIPGLFAIQANRKPHDTALLSGGRQVSYQELDERSNKLARYLIECGVREEAVVGVFAERSVEQVVSLLAIMKAGGVYLPLDPTSPRERLSFMVSNSGTAVLLVQERWLDHLPPHQARQIQLRADWPAIAQRSAAPVETEFMPEALAYIIYTSGSTGRPKAVAATVASLMNRIFAQDQIAPFSPGDICCQKTTIGFVDSILETLAPLMAGHPLIIVPDMVGKDVDELLKLIAHNRVTRLITVPSLARALLDHTEAASQLQSISHWTLSGEALLTQLYSQLKRTLPGCTVVNLYGSSEAGADATFCIDPPVTDRQIVTIGKPLPNMKAYVLDERLEPVPIGVPGDLYLSGIGLARGYLNDSELTARSFISCPFDPIHSRMYRTGDMGLWREGGMLEFLGRTDHQIKIRGNRVELGEIEAALQQHSKVDQAVVTVSDGQTGDIQLIGHVTHGEVEAPSGNELRHHLRRLLPDYMIPVSFDVHERFPLNSSGKIDRRALQSAQPLRDVKEEYTPPQNETQRFLHDAWLHILGDKKLSIKDNFFDVGGNSLLITKVTAQVLEHFGVKLNLQIIFERPTIEKLAEHVDSLRNADWEISVVPPLGGQVRGEILPLTITQSRIWRFYSRCTTDFEAAACHIPLEVNLRGELDIGRLNRAFREVIARHEILRARIAESAGQPSLIVDEACDGFTVDILDLISLGEEEKEIKLREALRHRTLAGFALQQDFPIRASVVRMSVNECKLLVVLHEIVCDRNSLELLIGELAASYIALSRNIEVSDTKLPLQYVDYAIWHNRWLKAKLFEQENYWKDWIGSASALSLPVPHIQLGSEIFPVAAVDLRIAEELSHKIGVTARETGTSPYAVVLAAYQLFLCRWSAQAHFVIASEILGRNEWQTRQLIGPFARSLLIQANLFAETSFPELVRDVQAAVASAMSGQEISLNDAHASLKEFGGMRQRFDQEARFTWEKALQPLEFPILSLHPVASAKLATHFKFTLRVIESQTESLSAIIEFAENLLDRREVESLAADFTQILEAVTDKSGRPGESDRSTHNPSSVNERELHA